jgi:hypothetical protein
MFVTIAMFRRKHFEAGFRRRGKKGGIFMGQGTLKKNRRALRKTAKEEKNNIVSSYMTRNWDKVLVSAVSLIRRFSFKNRFRIAVTILFKPVKKPKDEVIAAPDAGGTVPQSAPARNRKHPEQRPGG